MNSKEGTRPERSSRGRWRWLVAGLAVLVVLGVGFVIYLAIAFGGEDFGPNPVIENRTDLTIEIFQEDPSGERSLILELDPHSSGQLPSHCAAATYVALTEDGVEVDRRSGTGECNLETWVIRSS